MIDQIKAALVALKILKIEKRISDLESRPITSPGRNNTNTSSSTAVIPQYDTDPVSPSPQDAWVLKTGSGGTGGGVINMVFGGGMVYPSMSTGGSVAYEFSYRTLEGTTKRVTIS